VAVRRFIAVLVALGLIAVAILIRSAIDDGNDDGGGDGEGKIQLVCTPELADVCRGLGSDIEVLVSEPGKTYDGLVAAGTTVGIAGWLSPGPWPQMVREARQRNSKSPLLTQGQPLARSQIGLAVWPDRLAVMRQFCKGDLSWKCTGEVAGKVEWRNAGGPPEWGAIKIGMSDPVNGATGLAALGAATVGYFGRTDLSSTDLDDPGFRTWLRGLARAQPDHPGLPDMLARGPAEAAASATFESVGSRLVAASARKPTLTYPAPVASADVVLGTTDTADGRRLAELVTTTRLVQAGWEGPRTPGAGLPDAGLLDALRVVWAEAAR
jgi:hypothetical protein